MPTALLGRRSNSLLFLYAPIVGNIPHASNLLAVDQVRCFLPFSGRLPFVADSCFWGRYVRPQILPDLFVLFILHLNDQASGI